MHELIHVGQKRGKALDAVQSLELGHTRGGLRDEAIKERGEHRILQLPDVAHGRRRNAAASLAQLAEQSRQRLPAEHDAALLVGERGQLVAQKFFRHLSFKAGRARKAVDGQNAGFVKVRQRHVKQGLRIQALGPRPSKKVVKLAGRVGVREGRIGLVKERTHALAQLGRGRFGKGHHQDAVDGDVFFQNQAQHDALKRIGFARAGTGFHKPSSRELGRADVKGDKRRLRGRVAHALSPVVHASRSSTSTTASKSSRESAWSSLLLLEAADFAFFLPSFLPVASPSRAFSRSAFSTSSEMSKSMATDSIAPLRSEHRL